MVTFFQESSQYDSLHQEPVRSSAEQQMNGGKYWFGASKNDSGRNSSTNGPARGEHHCERDQVGSYFRTALLGFRERSIDGFQTADPFVTVYILEEFSQNIG